MKRKRLDILQTAHIGSGITHMTYGHIAGQLIQMILPEYLYHQPGALMQMHPLLVGAHNPAALLTAVLKAVQRIIGIL